LVQFEILCTIYHQERISRKGAKAQRGSTQRASVIQTFAVFLCVFAPLRETVFFFSSFETDPLSLNE
jgi:hypothetical protein